MRYKLLTFFGFLLVSTIAWNSAACSATNNTSFAQTNNANKRTSNSVANGVNNGNANFNASNENSDLTDNENSNSTVLISRPMFDCIELAESPEKLPPTYNFKVSGTGKVTPDDNTRKTLNEWFGIFARAWLKPFSEGKAKDEQLILFASTRLFRFNRDNSLSEEPKKETAGCKVTDVC